MRLDGRRESSHVEDRRRLGGGAKAGIAPELRGDFRIVPFRHGLPPVPGWPLNLSFWIQSRQIPHFCCFCPPDFAGFPSIVPGNDQIVNDRRIVRQRQLRQESMLLP